MPNFLCSRTGIFLGNPELAAWGPSGSQAGHVREEVALPVRAAFGGFSTWSYGRTGEEEGEWVPGMVGPRTCRFPWPPEQNCAQAPEAAGSCDELSVQGIVKAGRAARRQLE